MEMFTLFSFYSVNIAYVEVFFKKDFLDAA